MPIKFNRMTYDEIADKMSKLSHKSSGQLTQDERILHAGATIIASFSSCHSWNTYNYITRGAELGKLRSSEVNSEFKTASQLRWKHVTAKDIREVSQMNITPGHFTLWMYNVDVGDRTVYKAAWDMLRTEFNKSCDDVTGGAKTETQIPTLRGASTDISRRRAAA